MVVIKIWATYKIDSNLNRYLSSSHIDIYIYRIICAVVQNIILNILIAKNN